MKTLVTGATGFIGSHVVEALQAAGHDVRAVVRPTSDTTHLAGRGVELATGDVTDPASLRAAMNGIEGVVHAAAVVASYGDWEHYRRVGVDGTQNVVDAAASAGVRRFVHLGSIAVYGFQLRDGTVLHESLPYDDRPEPWNHYVREKVLSERIVFRAHEAGQLEVISLRPSVVIGKRDRAVVPRALRLLSLPFTGTIGLGRNRVPCVVVEELAALAARALTHPSAGKAYNVSGRSTITQRAFFGAYAKAAGRWLQPFFVPYPVAMLSAGAFDTAYGLLGRAEEPIFSRFSVPILGKDSVVDSSLAARELGWAGEADYLGAIRESVEWYRAQAKRR